MSNYDDDEENKDSNYLKLSGDFDQPPAIKVRARMLDAALPVDN